LHSVRNLP